MYSIEKLHLDFRRRANKVDSLRSRAFRKPEIDEYLNEALIIYKRKVSEFAELNSHRVNDLRQLIKNNVTILPIQIQKGKYKLKLSEDFYQLLQIKGEATTENCGNIDIDFIFVQYDDLNNSNNNPHYKPSLEFREVNFNYFENNIIIYTEDIELDKVIMTYISKHPRLSYGDYKLPDGTDVIGNQDLILDSTNQPQVIADIAVLLASIDTDNVNFQVKLQKILNFNKL